MVLIESSMEEKIELDNPVRIIDAFVNKCNLQTAFCMIKGVVIE